LLSGTPILIAAAIAEQAKNKKACFITPRDLNRDLGYSRTRQRPDGKIITIYYYSTKTHPQQFIGATIWEPAHAAAGN